MVRKISIIRARKKRVRGIDVWRSLYRDEEVCSINKVGISHVPPGATNALTDRLVFLTRILNVCFIFKFVHSTVSYFRQ